jgi:hypothetical protein
VPGDKIAAKQEQYPLLSPNMKTFSNLNQSAPKIYFGGQLNVIGKKVAKNITRHAVSIMSVLAETINDFLAARILPMTSPLLNSVNISN